MEIESIRSVLKQGDVFDRLTEHELDQFDFEVRRKDPQYICNVKFILSKETGRFVVLEVQLQLVCEVRLYIVILF